MQKGEVVNNTNYKRGYKVLRGNDWSHKDQDKDAIYGVILTHPNTYDEDCEVVWIDNRNHPLKKYVYRTGRGGKFDLIFAEDTIDWSIDDIFADLDALAERFS